MPTQHEVNLSIYHLRQRAKVEIARRSEEARVAREQEARRERELAKEFMLEVLPTYLADAEVTWVGAVVLIPREVFPPNIDLALVGLVDCVLLNGTHYHCFDPETGEVGSYPAAGSDFASFVLRADTHVVLFFR